MKAFIALHFLHIFVSLEQIKGTEVVTTTSAASTPVPTLSVSERCERQKRCHECIQEHPECMWCSDKGLPLESKRCFSKSKPIECKSVAKPQGKVNGKTKICNLELGSCPRGQPYRRCKTHPNCYFLNIFAMQGDGSGRRNEYVKNHPQVVELSLRKGEKQNISLEYTDENRPLDLYILMDLSCTMQKHKEKVANLASTLADNLRRNLTNNLTIGFGSFVDKPLAPFGYLVTNMEKQTSCSKDVNQSFPYAFKNHLKMTDNITEFIDEVRLAGISFNYDVPEGTLDALLQSIVCTEQIGWRTGEGSRKLLVISTDGSFHLAGDGKLVGVVLPHDGMCHVDASGMYTHSAILDYPSISLVRQKIREKDVFVIFAVTKEQEPNYIQLSEALHPYAVTQGIDNDNNSITSVIENEYKKLVNTVTMLSEYKHKENVEIKFYAKCPDKTEYVESNQCKGVSPGVKVSFKAEVELKDCPSNKDLWKSNLTVYPQSSADNITRISLTMLCGCDCEEENHIEESSNECSKHGRLRCGICDECELGWGGPFCNCTKGEGDLLDRKKCTDPNTSLVCNNKGTCNICGICECNSVNGNANAFTGKYCECDNTDCEFRAGDKGLCNKDAEGGPHGECECSQCRCHSAYNGSRCECSTSDESCRDPKSPDKICNGFGSCECGNCSCEVANKGDYCEIQHAKIKDSCNTARLETRKCIKCLLQITDEDTSEAMRKRICKTECDLVEIIFKDRLDHIPVEKEKHVCVGTETDSRNCRIDFIIWEKNLINNVIKLEIESGKIAENCPTPAPLLEIIIGTIGGMVLFGVGLLLLWKTVTYVQDRREYESFEKAINAASWDTQENPLYRSTTTRFRNPVYVNYDEAEEPMEPSTNSLYNRKRSDEKEETL